MATSSTTLNEAKTSNRSDPSRMYTSGQSSLARLRPEKLDDAAIQKQISIIQEVCGDIDPDRIAVVFHESDYNLQNTIARIKAGDFEAGGWQTAKSNNKKKNHLNTNASDQVSVGGAASESERTSPTSSLRDGHRRQEQYQHPSSSRGNQGRRGNYSHRNHFGSRYSARHQAESLPTDASPRHSIATSKAKEEEVTPTNSSSTDEYEFVGGASQSLTFDNSLQKKTSLPSSDKRPAASSIPQRAVFMHPSVQFSTEPIDIQFGDIQWNDSIAKACTPSNSPVLTEPFNSHAQAFSVGEEVLSNHTNQPATNEIDKELVKTTSRLSSSSIGNSTLANNFSAEPLEGTSHLSDHLTDLSQQQVPLRIPSSSSSSLIDSTRLPPTSTPNTSEYTSPTSQTNHSPFLPNHLQASLSNTNNLPEGNSSAFTPYNTHGAFQPISKDYSQTSATYKTAPKGTLIQAGNYPPQTAYQLPPQQPFFVGTYPYPTPTLYPVITPVDPWSNAGFEPYPAFPAANYLSTYPTQAQYHPAPIPPAKYDHQMYDKEFFAHYGQTRVPTNDLSSTSHTAKDTSTASKLSANAASFSQGAPMTGTSPAATVYINPVLYPVPAYYPSRQDRPMSYSSVDSRDNRNGASYGGHNNRNYHPSQQRTQNNSTRHSQQ